MKKAFLAKLSTAAILLLSLSVPSPAQARRVTIQGKCAFLLDQSYDENCSITIKDGYMTLLPKRSGLTKIYGQQISDFNLADKTTMRMDESLALYESSSLVEKGSKWVKDATKRKIEQHEIVIGYVDVRKTNPASLVLIVIDDKSKASALTSQLSRITGLRTGER